jgi:hypothetical protein
VKKLLQLIGVALLVLAAVSGSVLAGGINDPEGVPLYVIIEVDWDGQSPEGDWTVWGPRWAPVVGVGTPLSACTDCLEMNYEFTCRGKTLQFDETYVSTVSGTPQKHHVVLDDLDGDGVYTGSLAAAHYFPWRAEPDGSWAILYFDRIDYEVTVDADCNVTNFHYLQYEHKKLP